MPSKEDRRINLICLTPEASALQAQTMELANQTLNEALADPALYTRDPKGFAAKTARLGAAQAELDAAETEWLELEMLREELEG